MTITDFYETARDKLDNREMFDTALDRPFNDWYNEVIYEGVVGISLTCTTFEEFQMKVDAYYLFVEAVYRELEQPDVRTG